MELVGILFAFPICLLASLVYTRAVSAWLARKPAIAAPLLFATFLVMSVAFVEAIILIHLGAYRAHQQIGFWFGMSHLIVFFLGPAAAANIALGIARHFGCNQKVQIVLATLLCFVVCIVLLFGNIAISEDIYGIDGTGVRPGSE